MKKTSDQFGSKKAKSFRLNTKGITQREALVERMLEWAGVRRAAVAVVVYEHLLYQIASTSCPLGPWSSSVALAARTGFSPDAVTRALRTLRKVGLIKWANHKQHGAPTRHFTLLNKARTLITNVVKGIRQIKQAEPPKPLTTYQQPKALQIANDQKPPQPAPTPPTRTVGREALAALRQSFKGGNHGV